MPALVLLLCLQASLAAAATTRCVAKFLSDHVPFGDLGQVELGRRQGFSVASDMMDGVELQLTEIPDRASLESDGVEVLDLRDALQTHGIHEDSCDLSSKPTRLAIGSAMLAALEVRFQREVMHLGDTSRVSGGAVYGEATVRNTSSAELRNAHHVFHQDKHWSGIANLLNAADHSEAVSATISAQWPFLKDDFAAMCLSREDYHRLVVQQSPGMLNLWVALTPGGLVQQPIALLLGSSGASPAREMGAISSMHVHINSFNDTITVMRSALASAGSAKWGFRPNMKFGEALLFYTDRTPHSAVWLPDSPLKDRASAEMRVVVTDRPLPRGGDTPGGGQGGAAGRARSCGASM